MGITSARPVSWEVSLTMNFKLYALSCLVAVVAAAPAPDADADAEADPQFLAAPYHALPAANCVTGVEILVTQTCVPSAEDVCSTEVVDTEEIEYEKVCKEVVDTICDAPVAPVAHAGYYGKREAEADPEADPQFFGGYAAHHVAPIAAHAVAHSVKATVTHACREVTTEHCVDNPKVKLVPVEVEHCHTVTKVACTPVENEIPKTTCEPVETTHLSHAAYAGYGHYGYGK